MDHSAGTKAPDTDGGTSEQTQTRKGPSIKVGVFLREWVVTLASRRLSFIETQNTDTP